MDMILDFLVDKNWLSSDSSSLVTIIIVPLMVGVQIITSLLTKNKLFLLEVRFKPKIMDIKPVMEAIYSILRAEGFKEFDITDINYFANIKSRFGLEPESISFVARHNEPVETILLYGKSKNLKKINITLKTVVKLIEGGVPDYIFTLNPTTVQLEYDPKKMTIKGRDTSRWEEMTTGFNKIYIIAIPFVIISIMLIVFIVLLGAPSIAYLILFLTVIIIVFPTKLNKFSINNKVIRIKLRTHFDPIFIEYTLKDRMKKYFDAQYIRYKDHPGSYGKIKLYFMWGKIQLNQTATQLMGNESIFEMAIIVQRKHRKAFCSNIQLDLGNFLVISDQEKLLDKLYPEDEDILSKRDNLIRDIQNAEITKRDKQLENVASFSALLKNLNYKKLIPLGIALLLIITILFISSSASMDKYIVYNEISTDHEFSLDLDQYSFVKIQQVALESEKTQTMYGIISLDKIDTISMNWQNWENQYHYDREYWLAEDTILHVTLNSDAPFELTVYTGYNHPSSIYPILSLLFVIFIIPILLVLQIHNKEGENTILEKLYPKTEINEHLDIYAMTSPHDLGTNIGISLQMIIIYEIIAQAIFFGLLFILMSQDILTTEIMAFYSLGYAAPVTIKNIYLMWTALTLYFLAGRKREDTSLRNLSSIYIILSLVILIIMHPGIRSYLGLAIEPYI